MCSTNYRPSIFLLRIIFYIRLVRPTLTTFSHASHEHFYYDTSSHSLELTAFVSVNLCSTFRKHLKAFYFQSEFSGAPERPTIGLLQRLGFILFDLLELCELIYSLTSSHLLSSKQTRSQKMARVSTPRCTGI